MGRVDGALDREGQPLDRVALQAEMRFAKARRESGAEDFQLAMLLGQPELDAVPVKPRGAVALARSNRGRAELADVAGHLGIVVGPEPRDVTEHVVESVGGPEIIKLLPGADEIA